MNKVEEKKRKKKEALFNTAYELFTTKGIQKTAISDIVEKAGVAKGTFYLYFTDKYDIRNKLITHKANELFSKANRALNQKEINGVEDKIIFIVDYIVDELIANRSLLTFISKNLVWGVFRSTMNISNEETGMNFYEIYEQMLESDEHHYQDREVMLFTIIELVGSTCYNSILYEEPIPILQYKPYLFRTIRLIIKSHRNPIP